MVNLKAHYNEEIEPGNKCTLLLVIWHSMNLKSKCMIRIFELLPLLQITIDLSPCLFSAVDILKLEQKKMNEKN